MSLNKKLIINFSLLIITTIFITSLISNTMINKRFEDYLIEEHNAKLENVKDEISNLYRIYGDELSESELSKSSTFSGFYIEVKNTKNQSICRYDGRSNNHMGMMKSRMKHNMKNSNTYIEKNYSLLNKQDEKIGTLIIRFYDSYRFTKSAQIFKSALSQSLFISAIVAIILGFLLSIFLSKELSSPLAHIRNTANEMTKGNLAVRSNIESNTKEIIDLANSIDYLAETLQKQDSFRKKYITDIAHELRTPLTTLQTHVEAFIDEVWKPDKEHLLILHEEISLLGQLIQNLREVSKLEETELILNKSYFNISNETQKIVESFIPLFKKDNYEIDFKIEPDISVLMDKDKYRQIMYNLISNAHNYLNKNGKVSVDLSKKANNIIIHMGDNGIGISENDLPYIFERYFRSETSRNKQTKGSGLGLSIVKSLVETHNGTINVKSTLGKGTIFTIVFPLE